jgi:ribonuclease BN (tRNA processing enzyme)
VSLRLTVLGSAAAWSVRPGRPSSGYLVEHPEGALVLDLGQGSLGALFGRRDPITLAGIAISHEHGDHHVDLIPLRTYLRYGREEPRSVPLLIPDDLRRRYDVFTGEPGFLDVLPGPELVPGIRQIGPFDVQVERVTHSLMSHAFRVTDQARPDAPGLVYSGDCGKAEDLLPLIRPGDTLLCEAFWSTLEPIASAMHLSAEQAAEVARRSGASRLILTHILDDHDPSAALMAASAAFQGPVLLAEPDLIVEIGDA